MPVPAYPGRGRGRGRGERVPATRRPARRAPSPRPPLLRNPAEARHQAPPSAATHPAEARHQALPPRPSRIWTRGRERPTRRRGGCRNVYDPDADSVAMWEGGLGASQRQCGGGARGGLPGGLDRAVERRPAGSPGVGRGRGLGGGWPAAGPAVCCFQSGGLRPGASRPRDSSSRERIV